VRAAGGATLFAFSRRLAATHGAVCRRRRYARFTELCGLRPGDRIVDVGSGAGSALARFNREHEITAVDLERWPDDPERPNVHFVQGDGCALPFADRSFDVAFSNSVIEHVELARRESFAREVRRVCDRYFVQTPNRWFPIEPHYQLPLFQFVPDRLRHWIVARVSLGWQAAGAADRPRLLGARELRRLFPDATIHRERFLGLTKSLMAVRESDTR
jgi:SAM-dependent methyltransferase